MPVSVKRQRTIIAAALLLLSGTALYSGPRAFDAWERLQLPGTRTIRGRILCYRPARETGRVIILLHGWKQNAASWMRKTDASQLAEQYGTVLIAPEMGTCNYMTAYYPETHPVMRWFSVPSTVWMKRALLPWIRKRFNPKKLFIAGVSTGARGALMTAQQIAGFSGVGYISGDWDIIKDKGNLYRLSLGPLDRFHGRWEINDTSRRAAALTGTRVFMAHSTNDRVTPSWQTSLMKSDLDKLGIKNMLRLDSNGGHTWAYWNSRLPAMFRFLMGG